MNEKEKVLEKALDKLMEKFEIWPHDFWRNVFSIYLFHGEVPEKYFKYSYTKEFSPGGLIPDICYVYPLNDRLLIELRDWEKLGEDDEVKVWYFDALKEVAHKYPVGILLSPYISLTQLKAYISKQWPVIERQLDNAYMQKAYADNEVLQNWSLGRTKPRVLRERDSFIMKLHLEGKDRKTILARVVKRYGKRNMDANYISTIIAREKKHNSDRS